MDIWDYIFSFKPFLTLEKRNPATLMLNPICKKLLSPNAIISTLLLNGVTYLKSRMAK